MRRFFFNPKEQDGQTIVLPQEESHHIKTVLRLKIGDELELMDGGGTIYSGRITGFGKRTRVEITGQREERQESATPLWVGQGLIKSKKMDLIIQKCTELGVQRFIPFISSRCQGRFDGAQLQKKLERWQRISEEACKQCGRARMMEIAFPLTLQELLDFDFGEIREMKLLFWEEERGRKIKDLETFTEYERIHILFGPEGGITSDECRMAQEAGWQSVSLGSRILRAETAVLAAVSIIQHRLDEM